MSNPPYASTWQSYPKPFDPHVFASAPSAARRLIQLLGTHADVYLVMRSAALYHVRVALLVPDEEGTLLHCHPQSLLQNGDLKLNPRPPAAYEYLDNRVDVLVLTSFGFDARCSRILGDFCSTEAACLDSLGESNLLHVSIAADCTEVELAPSVVISPVSTTRTLIGDFRFNDNFCLKGLKERGVYNEVPVVTIASDAMELGAIPPHCAAEVECDVVVTSTKLVVLETGYSRSFPVEVND